MCLKYINYTGFCQTLNSETAESDDPDDKLLPFTGWPCESQRCVTDSSGHQPQRESETPRPS